MPILPDNITLAPRADTCRATITDAGGIRSCGLARGHYVADPRAGKPASWHTDCSDARGHSRPPSDQHDHGGWGCTSWSDAAFGAAPDLEPARDAAEAKVSANTVLPVFPVYTARLTIDSGDTPHTGDRVFELQVTGTAKVIESVVSTAVDAFREDAER